MAIFLPGTVVRHWFYGHCKGGEKGRKKKEALYVLIQKYLQDICKGKQSAEYHLLP